MEIFGGRIVMWVSDKVVGLFQISKDTVDALREELGIIHAERDILKSQLLTAQSNFSWLTTRINALEAERAQLLKKAYNVEIPFPEIVRTHGIPTDITPSIFEDMDDEQARKIGLPVYGN